MMTLGSGGKRKTTGPTHTINIVHGKHYGYSPFDELRCSIVLQAMTDWLTGQKYLKMRFGVNDLGELVDTIRKKYPDEKTSQAIVGDILSNRHICNMVDAQQFFTTDWCEDLCGVKGDLILTRLKNGQTCDLDHITKMYITSQKIQAA